MAQGREGDWASVTLAMSSMSESPCEAMGGGRRLTLSNPHRASTHTDLKPGPSASLFSFLTTTLASFSVSFSMAWRKGVSVGAAQGGPVAKV